MALEPDDRARFTADRARRADGFAADARDSIPIALDVDDASAPRAFRDGMGGAVARGNIGYDDFTATGARRRGAQVRRRVLRALRRRDEDLPA